MDVEVFGVDVVSCVVVVVGDGMICWEVIVALGLEIVDEALPEFCLVLVVVDFLVAARDL